MRFTSDNQRKAMFAQMGGAGANKFARKAYDLKPVFDTTRTGSFVNDLAEEPTRVEGYTGAQIEVAAGPSLLHPHIEYEGTGEDNEKVIGTEYGKDTYILAGEDYKKNVPGSLYEIYNIQNPSRKDKYNIVVEETRSERDLGRPVFSQTADLLAAVKQPYVARSYVIEKLELHGEIPKIEFVKKLKPAIDGTDALDRAEVINLLDGDFSIAPQKEYISGGYADGYSDDDFDQDQLQKGIEVEKEHVIKFTDKGSVKKFKDTDLSKAKEIAKDHLMEIPDYYDRLDAMEEGAKEEGKYIDVVKKKSNTIEKSI